MPNISSLKPLLASIMVVGAFMAPTAIAGQVAIDGSSKADKLDKCVEPTSFMRRNHMELILHQRDETVHEGIRTKEHSLANCIDCHVKYDADKKPVPINAEGQFCESCHDYAAVELTCFQCHSTVPRDKSAALDKSWMTSHLNAIKNDGKTAATDSTDSAATTN